MQGYARYHRQRETVRFHAVFFLPQPENNEWLSSYKTEPQLFPKNAGEERNLLKKRAGYFLRKATRVEGTKEF